MILFFRIVILLIVFINFRIRANKLNIFFIYRIFIEIKSVRVFIIKLIVAIILFLLFNYNRYIYYGVGLTINYGYVAIYAFVIILMLWFVWIKNNILMIISHFLPSGIEGLLKLFIPILEIIGVIIRPITLAIRLATNIRCGHVVLLIFRFFAFNLRNFLVVSISLLLFGLYFIEFLVCAIQAYVFWRLIYIYFIEIEI